MAKAIEEGEIEIIDCVVVLQQIKDIIGEHELVIVSHACSQMVAQIC